MQAELDLLDAQANRHTLRCMKMTAVVLVLAWLLVLLGLLPINNHLMNLAVAHTLPTLLLPSLICRFSGTEGRWVKYLLLVATELSLLMLSTFITYYAVLLFALPMIYAAQYSNRRLIYYTFGGTVAALAASVMLGYYFGLCDMNMLLQSSETTLYYLHKFSVSWESTALVRNPWITLPLYYILPRCAILALFVPVISEISQSIARNAVRTHDLLQRSETDEFTQFGNKDKYLRMRRDYYPTLSRIGVIFWDVDHLKETNDTYGHAVGDELLTDIADCIHAASNNVHQCYRIGGDEFLLIAVNPADGDMEALIDRFHREVAHKNSISRLALSASVGYAIGPGRDIEALVRQADAAMYREKSRPAARART
jgi:diguanylate cyclase (GGDEF)-like protein